MIEQTDLMKLLESYKIDYKKVMTDKVLDKGEYFGIKHVLEYLVNELKINPKNIEKCPSILYLNVNEVRKNYEFLKQEKINISDVETCLHVLSTDNKDLKETYYYVLENYGLMTINRITSILRCNKDRIINIEKYGLSKDVTISASVSRRTIYEIEKIIKVCRENNIPITGSVFLKTADAIEKIIKVCRENNIPITGSIFIKTAEDLQASIDYVKNTYGQEYLVSLVVSKNVKHLQKVLPYLDSLDLLSYIIESASILRLTLEEIMERKEYIESQGESLITKTGRFNSIFGLSRKNYEKLRGMQVNL